MWSIYIKIDGEWVVTLGPNTHHLVKATTRKVIRENFEGEEVEVRKEWLVIL
jgi:hypothetical protein